MSQRLPDKLFFRIGEVATIVGVEPHVLRYWETEFRSVKPVKSGSGQRVYARRDVETLLKVRELLYVHRYTIPGAKRRLRTDGVEPIDETDPTLREVRSLRTGLLDVRAMLVSALDGLAPLDPRGRLEHPAAHSANIGEG